MSVTKITTSTPHRPQRRPPIRNNLLSNDCSDIMTSNENVTPVRYSERQSLSRQASPQPKRYRNEEENADSSEDPELPGREDDEEGLDSELTGTEDDEDIQDEDNAQNALYYKPEDVQQKSTNQSTSQYYFAGLISIGLVILAGLVYAGNFETLSEPQDEINYTLSTAKEEFPNQDDFIWLSLEAGINDVVTYKRPSTFVLVYTPESEQTVNRLLKHLTKFALCRLSQCSETPVILNGTILNKVSDYGVIIENYTPKLKQKAVMIVNNLETLEGMPAQAFHSFCDQENPLVERSLFLFTMKLDGRHDNNLIKSIGKVLRDKWSDLKADIFHPLITRIVNIPLQIVPEQ